MPAKLIDDSLVERLYREGLGPKAIAGEHERLLDVKVTPEAISMWLMRHGYPRVRQEHLELIPWRVKRAHWSLYPAKMLRFESRRREGLGNPPQWAHSLDLWLNKIYGQQLVVHYDPNPKTAPGGSTKGWFYVDRRSDIDNDIIRDPRYNDDGSPTMREDLRVASEDW